MERQAVYENMWEMMGSMARHGCNGRMLSADDPKNLIVGYVCDKCDDFWEMKVSCIKGMPRAIGNHMKTAKNRFEFPKEVERLHRLGGYVFVYGCDDA